MNRIPLLLVAGALWCVGAVGSPASPRRPPVQRYHGPAAKQNTSPMMNRYCYLPDTLPSEQLQELRATLYGQGVAFERIVVGGPLGAFLGALPPGCTASVYTLRAFGSSEGLLSALQALRPRRIALRSLCEPWLNDPLADTARLLARFEFLFSSVTP